MPQLISFGSEMIRINPANNRIEYSTNRGFSWCTRYSGISVGTFVDLLPYGNEIIAATSKGIYYSTNKGSSWCGRYLGNSSGSFLSLMDGGREILAQTSKGLYYSTNKGSSWCRRN